MSNLLHKQQDQSESWVDQVQPPSWSPWSRWRLMLKLLYVVVVPGVIIYLLQTFDESPPQRPPWASLLHEQEQGAPGQLRQQQSYGGFELWNRFQGYFGDFGESRTPREQTLTKWATFPFFHHWKHRHQQHQQQQGTESEMVQQISYDQFVLLGDSITQHSFDVNERGFGAQLAHLFHRRLDFLNRGFSGYTTEQAIHLLPQFLPHVQDKEQDSRSSTTASPKIQFLTIFYGANDACLSPAPQHVDIERYEHNIRSLIDMVHSPNSPTYSPEIKIIVICPPAIHEGLWAARRKSQGIAMDRNKDVTRQYAEICLKIGKEYQSKNSQHEKGLCQVDVIDTCGLMMEGAKSGKYTLDEYLKDGLHLASPGNDLIFQEIMKIVRSRYPEWDPDNMPMHAPLTANLDREHPETDLLIGVNKVNA